MVSTQDSESCDPSSNLGGTYHYYFNLQTINNVCISLQFSFDEWALKNDHFFDTQWIKILKNEKNCNYR